MGGDRDDNPLRLIVREFDGRKGPEYTAWRKELLDALAGKGDDDASLADTVMKKDRRAGLSAAEAKRRKTRIRQAYAHIIAPLTDPDLKSVLRDEAFQDGVAALEVLDRECGDSQSALRQNQRILEWHATTIPKDVGIQESSIVDLSRKLTTQNEAMGKLFSADETTEKILGAIVTPPSLAQWASDLLGTPKDKLPERYYTQPVPAAGGIAAVPGGWVKREVVAALDEMWRAAFKRGELRTAAPARRGVTPPSSRADGMTAHAHEHAHAASDVRGCTYQDDALAALLVRGLNEYFCEDDEYEANMARAERELMALSASRYGGVMRI